ncbi:ATP-binding protein [Wenjunlia vitaminophila]|uniref:ATP-binding protein n=1 Tax=Wenjunlia vitaminophila TaxID=76728 RepID=A0A0T6LSE7_WENVI|nr:NACHT domain-containing protein [Wenjunlia vitaminophila]KRV48916.1 ATP-binding protein [Wenjunlia vitaminophila]
MEPGSLGVTVRLTSAVAAPLVRKLFARPGRGADLVERPVRIAGLVAWRGEKRTLTEKDVRRLVTELVRRAVASTPPHERTIPPDEEGALVEALTTTLLALGEITMDDAQAVRLGHRSFARQLRQHVPEVERSLSADASAAYRELLELSCLHVLHFFTQRSTFVARTLLDHSRALEETVCKLDLLLDRIPEQSVGDAAFEDRYRRYVAEKYGKLTIVGLDLRSSRADWPLDSAYLSLEAVPTGGDTPHDPLRMSQTPQGPRRADQALAGQRRVLLRGVAGSGKTTLVQWLAVSAARQDVTTCLPHLLGTVPFVLPLRTVVRRGELPAPDELLRSTGNPLHSAQPTGWADRVLTAGRALLLVDGFDEIPERERERTRGWLRDLITAFPDNLWMATSRPSAIADGWLADAGFHELTLTPMNRPEVSTFVERWHRAARATTDDQDERQRLDGFQNTLLDALHRKHDLSRLATNPLMCALVCALHRDRRAHLPRGRKELYDAALSLLLDRRDTERDVGQPDGIWLSEAAQVQLLQRLAYWLIRNGQVELERDLAVELIADALPSMPAVSEQGDAPAILRHLLVRSGLLRQPTEDTVDFVHRTFQDYLGAKAAVEARDFDLMVRNAHDDQWEDVIRMAVAHARPDERARLLRKLVARGDRVKSHRARLHLLATACLEHATELDPAVREEVERRAAALVPPRDNEQARVLAEAGTVVLDLLPGPEGLTDEEARCVVVAATQVASDAAIPLISRFRSHPSLEVRAQLVWGWHRYDTDRYAEEVIAHLDEDALFFVVRSREELHALRRLGGRPWVQLRGDFTAAELTDNLDSSRLVSLHLLHNESLDDLSWINAFPQLKELVLLECPNTRDLTPLVDSRVTDLGVYNAPRPSLSVLLSLNQLTRLTIGSPPEAADLNTLLPRNAPLIDLAYLNGRLPVHGLRGLSNWRSLREIALQCAGTLTPADWAELAALPNLATLYISENLLDTVADQFPGIQSLTVIDPVHDDTASRYAPFFPNAEIIALGS